MPFNLYRLPKMYLYCASSSETVKVMKLKLYSVAFLQAHCSKIQNIETKRSTVITFQRRETQQSKITQWLVQYIVEYIVVASICIQTIKQQEKEQYKLITHI